MAGAKTLEVGVRYVGIKNTGAEAVTLVWDRETCYVCKPGTITPVPDYVGYHHLGDPRVFGPRKLENGSAVPADARHMEFERKRVLNWSGHVLGQHPSLSLIPVEQMRQVIPEIPEIPLDAFETPAADKKSQGMENDGLGELALNLLRPIAEELEIDIRGKKKAEIVAAIRQARQKE